jgi:hypothetical protein
MIRPISNSYISFSPYAFADRIGSRVGVPVAESQAIYANFKHIFGVPQEGGATIDRLSVLNAIIDRLASIKKDPEFAERAKNKQDPMTPDRLDALILQYEKELKAQASKPALPYAPQPALPAAIAVDILA